MRIALAAALASLALVRAPDTAHACACCDGWTNRVPIGWSDAGELLIHASSWIGCEPERRLEVWRFGATDPGGCYDLYGDPDKRVPCDQVTKGQPYPHQKPGRSKRARDYRRKSAPLPASFVRARRKLAADDPEGHPQLGLAVDVSVRGAWRRVWSGEIHAGESYEAGRLIGRPLRVTVWPDPEGDRALLLVENENLAPGSGHWAATVRWVAMPR